MACSWWQEGIWAKLPSLQLVKFDRPSARKKIHAGWKVTKRESVFAVPCSCAIIQCAQMFFLRKSKDWAVLTVLQKRALDAMSVSAYGIQNSWKSWSISENNTNNNNHQQPTTNNKQQQQQTTNNKQQTTTTNNQQPTTNNNQQPPTNNNNNKQQTTNNKQQTTTTATTTTTTNNNKQQQTTTPTPTPTTTKTNNQKTTNNKQQQQQTNNQQTTNNKQHTTHNTQHTTHNKQQTTNNKQQQQTTNNKQQTTNNKQQTTNNNNHNNNKNKNNDNDNDNNSNNNKNNSNSNNSSSNNNHQATILKIRSLVNDFATPNVPVPTPSNFLRQLRIKGRNSDRRACGILCLWLLSTSDDPLIRAEPPLDSHENVRSHETPFSMYWNVWTSNICIHKKNTIKFTIKFTMIILHLDEQLDKCWCRMVPPSYKLVYKSD